MPRFQILDQSGHDLGTLDTPQSSWRAGDRVLFEEDEKQVEVTNIVRAAPSDKVDAYLIVRVA